MEGALAGVTVVDLTSGVAGPHGTLLLAAHGADVIKVEPLGGDWSRSLGRTFGAHSAHSIAFNRGKRSISVDLKSETGRGIVRRLAARADVFVESFRPGVLDRLGLGWEQLSDANARLIYCSVNGFGPFGVNRSRRCVDLQMQAFSGMAAMNGSPGEPRNVKMIAIDIATGLYVYHAVSGALFRAARGSSGCQLTVSLAQSAAAFQQAGILQAQLETSSPTPLNMPRGLVRAADGRHLALSTLGPGDFARLCDAIGKPEMATDPRFEETDERSANGTVLMEELGAVFATRPADKWIGLLRARDIMVEVVRSYGEWLTDEDVKQASYYEKSQQANVGPIPVVPLPLGGGSVLDGEPEIGQHTADILAGLGYGRDEIDRLAANRTVRLGG